VTVDRGPIELAVDTLTDTVYVGEAPVVVMSIFQGQQ
jgi:hypothetical protein